MQNLFITPMAAPAIDVRQVANVKGQADTQGRDPFSSVLEAAIKGNSVEQLDGGADTHQTMCLPSVNGFSHDLQVDLPALLQALETGAKTNMAIQKGDLAGRDALASLLSALASKLLNGTGKPIDVGLEMTRSMGGQEQGEDKEAPVGATGGGEQAYDGAGLDSQAVLQAVALLLLTGVPLTEPLSEANKAQQEGADSLANAGTDSSQPVSSAADDVATGTSAVGSPEVRQAIGFILLTILNSLQSSSAGAELKGPTINGPADVVKTTDFSRLEGQKVGAVSGRNADGTTKAEPVQAGKQNFLDLITDKDRLNQGAVPAESATDVSHNESQVTLVVKAPFKVLVQNRQQGEAPVQAGVDRAPDGYGQAGNPNEADPIVRVSDLSAFEKRDSGSQSGPGRGKEQSADRETVIFTVAKDQPAPTAAVQEQKGKVAENRMFAAAVERLEKIAEQYSGKTGGNDLTVRVSVGSEESLVLGLKDLGGRISVEIRASNQGIINLLQSQKDMIVRHLEGKDVRTNIFIDPNASGDPSRRDRNETQQHAFAKRSKKDQDFRTLMEIFA